MAREDSRVSRERRILVPVLNRILLMSTMERYLIERKSVRSPKLY